MTDGTLVTAGIFRCATSVDVGASGARRSLELVGEFDGAAAVALDAATAALGRVDELAVDLSAVTFVDSMGLRVLVRWKQAADDMGQRFVLERPSAAVERLLHAASLADYFDVRTA